MPVSKIELQGQSFAGVKLGAKEMAAVVPVIVGLRKPDGTPMQTPAKTRVKLGTQSNNMDCG